MTHDETRPGPYDRHLVLAAVGRRCVQELGVESATVAIATGPDAWVPAYASSGSARELEQYAYTVGEGPCFDTLRDQVPVVVGDLELPSAARRWPMWTRKAAELEVRSVAAFPIQAGAISAGVITVYSRVPGPLTMSQMASARRLADLAFLGLLDLKAGLDHHEIAEADLSMLLRAEVHRAAGMVMAQAGVTIDDALIRLRAYAFGSGRTLTDVAADVVARRLRFDVDNDAAQ